MICPPTVLPFSSPTWTTVAIVVSGWEGIFSIPEDAAAAAPVLQMLTTDYGVVTLDQIRAHAETYLPNNDQNCQNAFRPLIA